MPELAQIKSQIKMVNNTISDPDSSWEERADEGPISSIEEAKGWGQISLLPKKLKQLEEENSRRTRQ